jgi:hypothetical protein
MSVQLAGMAGTHDEWRQIKHCKVQLGERVLRITKKHSAPVTVAALAELTAELSCHVAGPDLTIYMLLELAKQIAGKCADREALEAELETTCSEVMKAAKKARGADHN